MRSMYAEVYCARCGNGWSQTADSFVTGTACSCLSTDLQPRWSFAAEDRISEVYVTVPFNFVMISADPELRLLHKSILTYHETKAA